MSSCLRKIRRRTITKQEQSTAIRQTPPATLNDLRAIWKCPLTDGKLVCDVIYDMAMQYGDRVTAIRILRKGDIVEGLDFEIAPVPMSGGIP